MNSGASSRQTACTQWTAGIPELRSTEARPVHACTLPGGPSVPDSNSLVFLCHLLQKLPTPILSGQGQFPLSMNPGPTFIPAPDSKNGNKLLTTLSPLE